MPAPSNTAYSLSGLVSDRIAQFFGVGSTPSIATQPTYAAAIDITQFIANSPFVRVRGTNATSATCSLTTTAVGREGQRLAVMCESIAAGTCTYTFSTGFKVSATAAATTLTSMTVMFVSNGTNWIEVGRSLAIAY